MTTPARRPGEIVRRARHDQGLTLAQLGDRVGLSSAQVSRYERGVAPLRDVRLLRCFADALGIEPQRLGLVPGETRRNAPSGAPYPDVPPPTLGGAEPEGEAVRRRHFLAVTAAAALGTPVPGGGAPEGDTRLAPLIVSRLRDAMLGLGAPVPAMGRPGLDAELARVHADYRACAYASLADRLPRLIRAAHAADPDAGCLVLARAYLVATRLLIKVDDQQLGWMAVDRARQFSRAADDAIGVAEAARQQSVLARKAGWHEQARDIALTASDAPGLRGGAAQTAARGLLIQSAAYSVAREGDAVAMRELTAEAAALAASIDRDQLRDHGGFTPATVRLHLISAETSAGDPSAALAVARTLAPASLPSVERRARYYTDVATAYARWGRRDECVRALLLAERSAPQETHARPAVQSLVSGLLLSGRTSADLRALAARTGVLV